MAYWLSGRTELHKGEYLLVLKESHKRKFGKVADLWDRCKEKDEILNKKLKDKVVQLLLENQQKLGTKVEDYMADMEPFGWMDPTIKVHLEKSLSEDQMKKLDETARANFAGRKLMAEAMKNAIKRVCKHE
jgi:hypothetical protein